MVFSSLLFIYIFLPVNLLCYAVISDIKKKNICLLIFSLIFYAWTSPKYLLVMMAMAMINYLGALGVEHFRSRRKSGYILAADITASLCILAFFKYLGFVCELSRFITGVPSVIPEIVLPVGISFYTFQLISYVVDVYRGDVEADHHYWKVLLYAALFHQCIAGPIVRYKDIADDLKERKTGIDDMNDGISRFCTGLAKKTLLANTCASIVESVLPESVSQISQATVLGSWFAMLLYALEIYLDFSAYSDMAIGLGKMIGFHYKENFNYPYTACSITDFWRRWHISLGTWFKDYVYIPLGGSREGKIKLVRNLLIVWFLTGFWHGASWNFIVWGLMFGIILIIEKLWLGKYIEKMPNIIRRLYVLFIVMISFIIFNANTMKIALNNIAGLFGANSISFINDYTIYYLKSYFITIVIGIIGATPLIKNIIEKLKEKTIFNKIINVLEPIVMVGMLFVITSYLIDNSYNPFLYFRF